MNKSRAAFLAAALIWPQLVSADEGGTSFWLPGHFGSLAAVPTEPGWSLPVVYYHASAKATGDKTFRLGSRIAGGLDAKADLVFMDPTYTFKDPVLGAQAAVNVAGVFGRLKVDIDATLTGPMGNTLLSGRADDTRKSVGDLYPMGTLKWNRGVHNFMLYSMGGLPVGAYNKDRLANIGTNHYSLDVGGAYTYFDPKAGHEFSAAAGVTRNFENKATNYRNGMDAHLELAASQFFSPQLHAGLTGYIYHQLTGDSGSGATLGSFKSRVSGIGPQLGYFFPVGGEKWYVNVKAIHEFDAKHRPDGWNAWLTLVIPFGEGK